VNLGPAIGGGPPPGSGESVDDRLRRIWQRAVDCRQALPGEHALAAALGVSRPIVREHLARLEHEGLISRRRGAGTVVNVAAGDIDVRFDMQIDYAKLLRKLGHRVKVEVLSAAIGPMASCDHEFFEVPGEWSRLEVVKRWRADEDVLVLADDVLAVPPDVHLENLDLSLEVAALVEQIRGTATEWTIAEPGAAVVEGVVAEQFERPVGSVALTIEVTGVGLDGTRLFRARELHVPGGVRFGFIRSRQADE